MNDGAVVVMNPPAGVPVPYQQAEWAPPVTTLLGAVLVLAGVLVLVLAERRCA